MHLVTLPIRNGNFTNLTRKLESYRCTSTPPFHVPLVQKTHCCTWCSASCHRENQGTWLHHENLAPCPEVAKAAYHMCKIWSISKCQKRFTGVNRLLRPILNRFAPHTWQVWSPAHSSLSSLGVNMGTHVTKVAFKLIGCGVSKTCLIK